MNEEIVKREIRRYFFNSHAHKWDSYQKDKTHLAIKTILNRCDFSASDTVLDVGAGTGILCPYFESLNVKEYFALDNSDKMIDKFREKYPNSKSICIDFESITTSDFRKFSKIIIFNTFPHFVNYKKVFQNAYDLLIPSGVLYICHSMNREALKAHHLKAGIEVDGDILISDKEMLALFRESAFKNIEVENSEYFFAKGIK